MYFDYNSGKLRIMLGKGRAPGIAGFAIFLLIIVLLPLNQASADTSLQSTNGLELNLFITPPETTPGETIQLDLLLRNNRGTPSSPEITIAG